MIDPKFELALRPILAATQLTAKPAVLLIHGDADSITPPQVGADLAGAMSSRAAVELWTAPGAGHTLAYPAGPDAYRERVIEFLQRAFAGPAAP